MYKLCLRKDAIKSLKKIKKSNSKTFVAEFEEIFKELCEDPYKAGIPYVGNISGFYKYCHGDSPEYRIIFSIHEKQQICDEPEEFDDLELSNDEMENFSGIIDIVFLKTREECNNLYKQNSDYFKDKLRGQ